MNSFLKVNKSLIKYSLIFFLIMPFLGFNFISIIGNIFLILFLFPILLFIIALIRINSLKPNINTCSQCGSVSLGFSETCVKCGATINENISNFEDLKNPSETTIEVEAEEIK